MSRLTDLLRRAKEKDPQPGADLEREFKVISGRRALRSGLREAQARGASRARVEAFVRPGAIRLDPRRRAALKEAWAMFAEAGGKDRNLADELVAERRAEAALEDQALGRE